MYAHFYRLAEDPFNLTPDPKFHYVNEATREAMASVLYGIESRKGFVTLVGEAGTGKTTLLKRVVEEIEAQARVVFVFNPAVSFEELLEFICSELGIPAEGSKRLNLIERLNTYLLEQLTEGRNVVVMIDEAQTLDDSVLEELRLLSNLETSKEKILQIILSGQPELEEKLRRPGLRQLRQRIGARAILKPMRAREIGAYVETRLRSAGSREGRLFAASALRRIWKASQGIPRVVNVICDNAMMIAFAEGKKRITAKIVRESVRDLESTTGAPSPRTERPRFSSPLLRYAGATALAGILAVPFALSLLSRPELTTRFGASVARHDRDLQAPTQSSAVDARSLPASEHAPAGHERWRADDHAAPVVVGRLPDEADHEGTAGVVSPEPAKAPSPVAVPSQAAGADPYLPEPEPTDPAQDAEILQDTIRRAELLARSTAARLFSGASSQSGAASAQGGATASAATRAAGSAQRSAPAAPARGVAERLAPRVASAATEPVPAAPPAPPQHALLAPAAASAAPVGVAPSHVAAQKPSTAPTAAPATRDAQAGTKPPASESARIAAELAARDVAGEVAVMAEEGVDATPEVDPLPSQMILEVPPPQKRSPSDLIAERTEDDAGLETARAEPAAAQEHTQADAAPDASAQAVRADAPQPGDLRYFELAAQALEKQLAEQKQKGSAAKGRVADTEVAKASVTKADGANAAVDEPVSRGRRAKTEPVKVVANPPTPKARLAAAREREVASTSSSTIDGAARASRVQDHSAVRELATASRSTRPGMALGPRRGTPLVGRLVEVGAGDTVWDIAIRYYGYAGPRTSSAILEANPQLRNPRHLVSGDQLYLPFLKPQQMVTAGPDGSYRVLLSSSPTRAGIDAAADWLSERMPSLKLRSDEASIHGDGYVLYAFGFTSKDAALEAADAVLVHFDQLSGEGGRRHADSHGDAATPDEHS